MVVRQLFSIFLLLAFSGCEKHGFAISVTEEAMAKISAQVAVLIDDKSCDGSADCASIAWGIDPCGNTTSYLVYKPETVDVPMLEQLVATYNHLNQELNQLTDAPVTTDCDVVLIEPEIDLRKQSLPVIGR